MTTYQNDFLKKYLKAREEKDSILCAGFDPAIPSQRKNKVLPEQYLADRNIEEGILAFFEDFLASVQDYCCAIKPNNQYLFHAGIATYQKINKMIHEQGLVSILDIKIGDIGSTNESGFYWMKEMGFDAATYSPFAGNIKESVEIAHSSGLGLIVLTLMSNPDAIYFMKNNKINNLSGYEFIAQQIKKEGADGMVVGATGHVTATDIKKIRGLTGPECVMLVPGIGSQQGDLMKVITHGGDNIMLNVSRGILYAEDMTKTAKKYQHLFNDARKK